MKLQQYIGQFSDPLRTDSVEPLLRLLDCRNKTARGLSDTIPPIEVSFHLSLGWSNARNGGMIGLRVVYLSHGKV